ncbi:hypothetical protein TUMEXPCC7403_19865 [Tumidithrix helvetica PCC 7403]
MHSLRNKLSARFNPIFRVKVKKLKSFPLLCDRSLDCVEVSIVFSETDRKFYESFLIHAAGVPELF